MTLMKLSFKNYYHRWIKNQFILFILFLALMSMARALFAFYFGDARSLLADVPGLKKAMILGLRYDLMPLAYIHLLPFLFMNLLYFIPGKFSIKAGRTFGITILFLGHVALAWIYVFDYGFYSYFQDHLNILFFGFFEDDTIAILVSIWKNYNLPLWLTMLGLLHYGFFRFVKFLLSPFEFDLKVRGGDWRMPLVFIAGVVSLAWAGRGNFSRLPLSIEDAHISSDEFLNKLSINGPISLNRALKIRRTFGKADYDFLGRFGFAKWEDAAKILFKQEKPSNLLKTMKAKTPVRPDLEVKKPHVVLVIMESYGSYWDEYNSQAFNLLGGLENHFKEGITFKNFLPAENGTIGSAVSIAVSQPIRPGARFLSESEFMNLPVKTAGHLPYKEAGYETHFLYGGKLGWRDLGKYLKVQGYDRLWGADEIKESMPELSHIAASELGNEWGVFDEYLYAFLEEKLRIATKPQFFLVLSTSNHPPFEYPTSYRGSSLMMPKEVEAKITVAGDLAEKRFAGVQYANTKMSEFISRIKTSPVKDKVVIGLTGDHSYWIAKGVGHEEEFKRYSVPFHITLPDWLKPKSYDSGKFGSHEDIFPTLYHLTLSGQEYVRLGQNMFTEDSFAMNSSGLIANKYGAFHHGQFWKWKDSKRLILEPSEETPELLELRQRAHASIGLADQYLKNEKKNRSVDVKSDRP
jgi:phosphoglycerol transferase MdoB-like AlkP superfamily enzyme